MENQRRVLVTALGTMNCTTIVSELRKSPLGYYIIGADINPAHSIYTSTEVDEYYQFPKATEDRELYYEYVRNFCIDHKVDMYFCVVDEEVETMALHRNDLSAIGVKLCVANTDAIVICHNKDKFADWSEKYIPECCIKRFLAPSEISENDYPLFVKPIEGRASIGCAKINNRAELAPYLNCWSSFIVQEYVSGSFISADVVRCKNTGLTQVCQRQELLRNGNGCGISVQIVKNDDIDKTCRKIASMLDLNGVVNVEFFVNEKEIRIIEVNPRIPAGAAYSCMAGLNLVELALSIADGEKITKESEIKIGSYYAKRYETYEISV